MKPNGGFGFDGDTWDVEDQTATKLDDDDRPDAFTGLYDQWGNKLYRQPIRMGFHIDE